MATSKNRSLLERVNNEEFLKLLPHLSLENLFLVQIFVPKKKWIDLLDPNFQTLQVKCGGCMRQIKFEEIEKHLKNKSHYLMCLRSSVKQFYHPFYTYGKGDIKLARGEHVPKADKESTLRDLNTQLKNFKKDCISAKRFADAVQRRTRELENDQLLQLTLDTKIVKPEEMFVMVCIPFENVPKLLCCLNDGKEQAMIGYKTLTKNSFFHCNLCDKNCSGMWSINTHLNGYKHKRRQLDLSSLRYEVSSKVNKNCCIQLGDSFSFSVKDGAREFFKDKIENITELGCKDTLHHTALSSDIAKKIADLDEQVPKTFLSTESLDVRSVPEYGGNPESNEYFGHLGVEYVLKIVKNDNDKDPKFECGLCEMEGDSNKMQRHLLNYEHKKKYLDLHYPDTIKKYESTLGHMRYMEFRAFMSEIVQKVACEIEKEHGRSLPYTVLLNDYKARRPDLIAEVYALLHASQNRGPSFSSVITKEELRNLKNSSAELAKKKTYKTIEYVVFTTPPTNKIYLKQVSHDPVVRLREYNAKMSKTHTTRNSRSISPNRSSIRKVDLRSDRSNTRNNNHHLRSQSPGNNTKSRSPRRGHHQGNIESAKSYNQNIWEIYRREIAIAANEIEIAYENYRKNPESHPLYEEEWNNFWQRRKKELEREGFNHRMYNFQPEWVHYFKQRIELLFGEALYKSQINVRRQLDIPLYAEEDCQRLQVTSNQYDEQRHMVDRSRSSENVDELKIQKRRSSIDYRGGPPPNKKQLIEERAEPNLNMIATVKDNHSDVVHVLRLISALEEHLGSLGGKIMDLLSNALQLEKNFRGNNVEFEAQILTASNCNLLETAMEKLKGILFAGLLDENKLSGFNRIIQYTTNLLKYAEKMGWRQDISPDRNTFHGRNINVEQESGVNAIQISNDKLLSDTLMELVNTQHTNKRQFAASTQQHSAPLICPPPPCIKGQSLNTKVFAAYKAQSNSGLASFDTKLSLDQTKNQSHQIEFGQQHRSSNNMGNSLNNNSFRNNNDNRTNINLRTNSGPNVGGSMNNNSGPTKFRNLQFIPNISQNNAMYQGEGGGGNRTWSRWNN